MAVLLWQEGWQINQLRNFSAGDFFNVDPGSKRSALRTLIDAFRLHRNGKVELQFKLTANEQVAGIVLTLLENNATFDNNNYEAIRLLAMLTFLV